MPLMSQPSSTPWLDNPLPPQEAKPPVPSVWDKLTNYALHDSIPAKAVQSAWSGFTAPGDAWAGKIAPEDMERRAWDMAGLATGGSGVVPAEANELRTGMKFPLFHGSPKEGLTEITPSTRGALGPGAYFSPNSNVAERYGGNLYQLPEQERNIFNGLGDRYGDYNDWKADKAALMGAVEPEMKDVIGPRIEQSWTSDGYPLYRNIAADYRDDGKATDLFRRAGFEGVSGHADGPEVALFDKQRLTAEPEPLAAPGLLSQPEKTYRSGYSYGLPARTALEDIQPTYGTDLASRPQRLLVNPESLQGSLLKGVQGDRTIRGSTLTGLNGMEFENPVNLHGGPGYMLERGGWASNKSIARGFVDDMNETVAAAKGKPVNLLTTTMGERSGDFSHMTTESIRELMKHSDVDPEHINAFDKKMRESRPDFTSLTDLDPWMGGAGTGRVELAKMLNTKKWQDLGMPDIPSIRYAVTEPELRGMPSGQSGYAISRIGPEGMKLGPSDHPTYDREMLNPGGQVLGGFEKPVPYSVAFPDWWNEVGQFQKGSGLDRTFGMQRPTQEANQQWLDNFMRWQQGEQ